MIYGDDYPSETFRVLKNNETRQLANTAPAGLYWRRGIGSTVDITRENNHG
jgi:hypothetical protein